MKQIKLCAFSLAVLALFNSCEKSDGPDRENPKVTTGLYALSEGSYSDPSTTLSYYNFQTGTAVTDFYQNANSSGLGSLGNDMIIYGSKIYIVLNLESQVEVAEALTAKHIVNIPLTGPGGDRQPRYAVAYKNKVLVSSYDGTVAVIDTTSLTVEKYITVGANPEQLAVVGDKLFVANSGGLQAVMDSTVSVVDLISQTETSKITVGVNPIYLMADDNGNIFVACIGNYWDIGPKLVKINTANNSIIKSADTAVGKMSYHDGALYATGGYLGSPFVRKLRPDDFSQLSNNFVSDGTSISTVYGITVDTENGDVYVTDAKNYQSAGEVFCFDRTGKKKFSFSTSPGVNPNTVVLIKQ